MALIRKLLGLILPIFSRAGDFKRLGAGLRIALHILLLAAILGGLWYANRAFHVEQYVPVGNELIRSFYLPLLFLALYLMCWVGWWVWKLLGPDADESAFPDIDAAWEEALDSLQAGAVNLIDTPLFLVLGQPATGAEAMFAASGQNLTVRPANKAAPVQVWANNDAIWVVAAGSCISAKFGVRLNGEAPSAASAEAPKAIDGPPSLGMATIGVKSVGVVSTSRSEIQSIMDRAHQEGRELTAEEKARMRQLAQPAGAGRQASRAMVTAEEASQSAARLRHLCRRIVRDRHPYCPANGVLIVIPWAATDTNEVADEAAVHVQRDLSTVRESLQLLCPTFALFADLEQARGFREFRKAFPKEQLKRRLGQRLPLAPDAPPAEVPTMFEVGANWIGKAVFPTWVYKMVKPEPDPDDEATQAQIDEANRNLYTLLREVRYRYPRLARILSRGVGGGLAQPEGLPPLFGGCYIAGTGRGPEEQAFVPGVLQRLIENQSYVSWLPEVFEEEDSYKRNTFVGYIGLGILLLAAAAGGAYLWMQNS